MALSKITTSSITPGAITSSTIAAGAVSSANISTLSASQISGGTISNSVFPSGTIVKITDFFNNTKVTISASSTVTFLTFSLTKLRTDTSLIITGQIPGRGNYSHWIGLWADWNGTKVWNGISYTNETSTRDGNEPMTIHYNTKIVTASSGTANLTVGYTPGNGATGERPFNTMHPDTATDARINGNGSVGSHFTIFEVIN